MWRYFTSIRPLISKFNVTGLHVIPGELAIVTYMFGPCVTESHKVRVRFQADSLIIAQVNVIKGVATPEYFDDMYIHCYTFTSDSCIYSYLDYG